MGKDKSKEGKRGRPARREMPERVPDSPENIMRSLVTTPPKPKEQWRYLKGQQ